MEVNCETLAVIGATLANGGVCPITRYIWITSPLYRELFRNNWTSNIWFQYSTILLQIISVIQLSGGHSNTNTIFSSFQGEGDQTGRCSRRPLASSQLWILRILRSICFQGLNSLFRVFPDFFPKEKANSPGPGKGGRSKPYFVSHLKKQRKIPFLGPQDAHGYKLESWQQFGVSLRDKRCVWTSDFWHQS